MLLNDVWVSLAPELQGVLQDSCNHVSALLALCFVSSPRPSLLLLCRTVTGDETEAMMRPSRESLTPTRPCACLCADV